MQKLKLLQSPKKSKEGFFWGKAYAAVEGRDSVADGAGS